MGKQEPIWLAEREFTEEALEQVRETIALFPQLSRHELALTWCENLDWTTPNGLLKVNACYQLLKRLEAKGDPVPPLYGKGRFGKEKSPPLTQRTQAPEPISVALAEMEPINVRST